jgi:DNA (cytosine-5)-methyltransferase 1
MWENGPNGCSPQGRGLVKQLAYELGEALSELPQQASFSEDTMYHLRQRSEGSRILRQALSKIQETWGSNAGQAKPAHAALVVRRLTPREAERLQGFPDDYTLIYLPKSKGKGKQRVTEMVPCADGPRYKALGNSMATTVIRWIGERIILAHNAWKQNGGAPHEDA